MKLLFDQNLSPQLVRLLSQEYPDSEHVIGLGMDAAEDRDIWRYAAQNGFIIVSKDVDFEQRALLRGSPPKVVRVKLGNCSTTQVATLLRSRRDDLIQFDANPSQSVLAIS